MAQRQARIAIIPARGGSKRIPRKNIIDFRGKPLIAWTIGAALECGCFARVCVSTDDREIARVAETCGVEVPFLRDAATDDHTPVSGATLRALEQASEHWREEYDTVCQLMPNCPLREAGLIRDALAEFDNVGAAFQISCFQFGFMNPWKAFQLDDAGRPTALHPEERYRRSQDLPPLYCPTGSVWIANVGAFREAGTFYGPDHRLFPIPWQAAVDIDDWEDFALAEAAAETSFWRRAPRSRSPLRPGPEGPEKA
jgi:CMP-N-acetylneuraminic acid synthetase